MAPISQSDTRWVKKPGKAGYVEQISTGKKVTGKIALSTTIGQGGKTINNVRGVADYSKGRNVTNMPKYSDKAKPKSPSDGGGGSMTPAAKKAAAVKSASAMTPREAAARKIAGATRATGAGVAMTARERSMRANSSSSSKPTISSTPSAVAKPKAGSTTKSSDRYTGSKNQMAGIAGMLGKKAFGDTTSQKRQLLAQIAAKQKSISDVKNSKNASAAATAAAKKRAANDAAEIAALKTKLRNLK